MVILLQQKNFGPNVIYFALGITEGRPAGAFWVDKIVFCQKVVPQGPFGQTKLSPKAAYWYYGGGAKRTENATIFVYVSVKPRLY